MAVPEHYRNIVYKLARFGCFSLGSVYLLVGVVAALSFFGEAEDAADEERAVNIVLDVPGGEIIIWLIIAGLAGYIVWRIFEAIKDPYEFGSGFKGVSRRIGVALSGTGYAIIAFSAFQVVTGNNNNNGEEEQQMLVSQVLEWSLGPWIIGSLGVITGLTGLIQFKYVLQKDYNNRIDFSKLSKKQEDAVHFLAHFGYFARGIILLTLAYFFFVAAINQDPGAIGDTDSAFDFIGGGLLGNLLFLAVAAGTASYGLFMYFFCFLYKFEKG